MSSSNQTFRFSAIAAIVIACALALKIGIERAEIESDITAALPEDDAVVENADYFFDNHPALDKVVFDFSLRGEADAEELVKIADMFSDKLKRSGLFKKIGAGDIASGMSLLFSDTAGNLPLLFNEAELNERIVPLLAPDKIRQALAENLEALAELGGIGQGGIIAQDPLGIRNVALASLADIMPSRGARIHKGHIVSADGARLLLIADPMGRGTDTEFSRSLWKLIADFENEALSEARAFEITPVGSFRAALDNETIIRRDTERAVLFATLGIALLLLLFFPRPYIGVFSLLPALFGAIMALFVYSLFNPKIPALALGFGAALISITVDAGIAFLIFLDRSERTSGKAAAREVWHAGLIATLTTVGAFASLALSGIPIMGQVGLFAALGILFAFLFVHTIFPIIFTGMPPAKRGAFIPIENLLKKLSLSSGRTTLVLAFLFFAFMLANAKPEFRVDLEAMNTVSQETLAAERLIKEKWGDIFDKLFLMVEAKDKVELQNRADELYAFIEAEKNAGRIVSAFSPSALFPGDSLRANNLEAWKKFWDEGRIASTKVEIKNAAAELGFADEAFTPFFEAIERPTNRPVEMPSELYETFGVFDSRIGGKRLLISSAVVGEGYEPEAFFRNAEEKQIRALDLKWFSQYMARLLGNTFAYMLVIIGGGVILLLLIFFLDIKLTLIAIAPILFALAATLGTLNLIERPVDIPGLMLAIVILGMGIDYSLYMARSHQRHLSEEHPSVSPIRVVILLAAASTLIGMGTISFAEHSVLQSAGVTAFIGVSYSLVGAFMILPPILRKFFSPRPFLESVKEEEIGSKKHLSIVLRRYERLEPQYRFFAYFKTRLDPMFPKLAEFVKEGDVVLDVGCGYGVPAAWLAAARRNSLFYGFDAEEDKVRVASWALGERGIVVEEKAPKVPFIPEKADVALMLDIEHYLNEETLRQTLREVKKRLKPEGRLVFRGTLPFKEKPPVWRFMEIMKLKYLGCRFGYWNGRQIADFLEEAGFEIALREPVAKGREETWFIAELKPEVQKGDE